MSGRSMCQSMRVIHGEAFADAAVERSHDADLMTGVIEGLGEGADHVGKAAGLGVGMNFAAPQKDAHDIR